MTTGNQRVEPSKRDDVPHAGVASAGALALGATSIARLQFEMMCAWQVAALAIGNELLAQWRCRWAGGVPLDA